MAVVKAGLKKFRSRASRSLNKWHKEGKNRVWSFCRSQDGMEANGLDFVGFGEIRRDKSWIVTSD